jgi:hypothetical protein
VNVLLGPIATNVYCRYFCTECSNTCRRRLYLSIHAKVCSMVFLFVGWEMSPAQERGGYSCTFGTVSYAYGVQK